MRTSHLGGVAALLWASTSLGTEFTEHSPAALENIRSNIETTHVQFPLHCPECFASLIPEDQEYLECDLQIVPPTGSETKEPAFMLNGHYVPEALFETQSTSPHVGKLRGISEIKSMPVPHEVRGTLHYETLFQKEDVDVKGVQLNLSDIVDASRPASYGLRVSYARSPYPVILRIAQMDVVDDPFADKEAWVKPPEDKTFSSMDKSSIEEVFMYGSLRNYGHECDVVSCRAHDISGLVSDRYKKFRGDMAHRMTMFERECHEYEDTKPLHCRVYEHKATGSLVVIGLVILAIFFLRRACRACCFFVLSNAGRKSEQGSPGRDEEHGKEI